MLMGTALKFVDDSPICDPEYLRQIDPVWTRGNVPSGFWKKPAHRRDYLMWLADRLGFHRMADFYRMKVWNDFPRNFGNTLLGYWHCSALEAVQECFPQHDWKGWLFTKAPEGFWDSAENRRSYLDWLEKELGFRGPEAWCQIRMKDIVSRGGGKLVRRCGSLYTLMREYLPQIAWDRINPHRPFTVDEVLAWADVYHARHGTWPTERSGTVPESGVNWKSINNSFKHGTRGLPGGTSLAKFLKEHRGVPVGRPSPQLTEEQILAWADAHFAAQGKWPTQRSGTIAGTHDTWHAVESALTRGVRGLPAGPPLPCCWQSGEAGGKRRVAAV